MITSQTNGDTRIAGIRAREILDSRGNPTIEVDMILEDGAMGRASVPSGASTGSREALELRDGNPTRYGGKGVQLAVRAVHEEIAAALRGQNPANQAAIDRRLIEVDGTPGKSRLGANAILGTSMAAARAAAASSAVPLYSHLAGDRPLHLPVPLVNVINGGAHAANALDFQEFMLAPVGASSITEAIRWCAEIFHKLRALLQADGHVTSVGDEGGYAPNLKAPEDALAMLVHAIQVTGYRPGEDVAIALDPAASELHRGGKYVFPKSGLPTRTSDEMIDWYADLASRFPIISIEDGLGEQDWEGWERLTARLGSRLQLVGDDIFVTNAAIISEGVARRVANSTLIKLNQIGTVTETLQAIDVSRAANYTVVISHRSGETEDPFIADLAVATGAEFIKTGSMSRSERLAKYNQLIRIEEELGSRAHYGGQRRKE